MSATAAFTLIISSAPATSVAVTPTTGLVAPVAAGTVLATIAVQPAGWQGSVGFVDASGNSVAAPTGVGFGGASPNYTLVATAVLPAETVTGNVKVTP